MRTGQNRLIAPQPQKKLDLEGADAAGRASARLPDAAPAPSPLSLDGRFVATSPAAVVALQRSAGNRAVTQMLQRQQQAASEAPLADRYRTALAESRQTGDWRRTAELLNAFNREDIFSRLAQLSDEEVNYLHLGAVGNPAVGPDSQVAQLTAPGAPRASTPGPNRSEVPRGPAPAQQQPAPAPGPQVDPADAAIAAMTPMQRLVEAYERAPINGAVREKIMSMMTPEALVAAIITFAIAFVASQFTPVGWAADISLGLSMIFIGTALIRAVDHLLDFAAGRNATTSAEIDRAANAFARAVAEVEVDVLLFFIARGARGGTGGAGPAAPPPSGPMVLAINPNGTAVMVATQTVPATVAAEWGILGSGTAMAMSRPPDDDDFGSGGQPRRAGSRRRQDQSRNERISDANKQELQESGWLRQLLPDVNRRREFMEWLETRHRQGEAHVHLRPGSREARAALDEFLLENP